MNCIVPGGNIKVLSKAIVALSKIGDELYIEAKPDELYFMAMNGSKTVFAEYKLLNAFFSSYEVAVNDEPLTCKVPMKSMLSIFKKSPLHKDKKIELCKIELENDATMMVFKFRYKTEITIVHTLYLIDYDSVSVSYNKDSATGKVTCTGRLFNEVLANFLLSDEDISFEFTPSNVTLRNYDAGSRNMKREIRSQVPLQASEFFDYLVPQDTNITLNLKPFRSAIGFSEYFNLNLNMLFEVGGRPAIIEIKNPTFSATYIMATVNSEDGGTTQTSVSTTETLVKEQRKNNKDKNKRSDNISVQDQTAIENMDWGDFDEGPRSHTKSSSNSSTSKLSFTDIINKELSKKNKEKSNGIQKTPPRNDNINANNNTTNLDVVPNSPESPVIKRARIVFSRCNEATFHPSMLNLGKELAPASDPESEDGEAS